MKWKTKIQKSMVILCAGAWSVSLGNAGAMAECQDQTEECNPVKYSENLPGISFFTVRQMEMASTPCMENKAIRILSV